MPVEDVFTITGRGTVATGRIKLVLLIQEMLFIGMGAEKLTSTITGVEMFRKILDRGEAGDNVGIVKSVDKEDYQREWLSLSQVQLNHTLLLKLSLYLEKEEGGRHTPFHNNYRPQFYVRDVTGVITLPEGVEWLCQEIT
jgi:elongation factor Tu